MGITSAQLIFSRRATRCSPRLSTYSSYQLGMVKYEDNLAASSQDRVDHTLGESLRYQWSPRHYADRRSTDFELIDYDTTPGTLQPISHLAVSKYNSAPD